MIGTIGSIRRATVTVGDYAKYQAAQGLDQVSVVAADAIGAINSITNSGKNLSALTYDSFVKKMGDAYGYPSKEIQSIINLAWPLLPASWRDRLSKRSAPAQQLPAQAPANPPVSAPYQPNPFIRTTAPYAGAPTSWSKTIFYGALGVAALAVGYGVYRRGH